MLLSHPSLYILDHRCCSILGEDEEWNAEDYSKSLFIVQQWTNQIPQ
jgi:hypothetical protein